MQLSAEQSQRLLEIARAAIRQTLQGQTVTETPESDPMLMSPAGCFVSLHQRDDHQLRGCVGRLDANGPLAQVVRQTAVSVLGDPRFANRRVQLNELANLEIEISVLSPLTAAKTPLDFDLLNDGLFLTISNRTGCFLPQVARQTGWSKEQLLDRLCMEKLAFPAKMWQHPAARLQKFTAAILGPEPFVLS
jgi:uncharacterized protein